MSRTKRMFLIAALIVFGLLAPMPADANLTHCTGVWQGAGDDIVSTCTFRLGGGALEVNGLAAGGPNAHVNVNLFRLPTVLYPNPIVSCSGAGPFLAQCSEAGSYSVPPTQFEVMCVVYGAAVAGVYSCRTV